MYPFGYLLLCCTYSTPSFEAVPIPFVGHFIPFLFKQNSRSSLGSLDPVVRTLESTTNSSMALYIAAIWRLHHVVLVETTIGTAIPSFTNNEKRQRKEYLPAARWHVDQIKQHVQNTSNLHHHHRSSPVLLHEQLLPA